MSTLQSWPYTPTALFEQLTSIKDSVGSRLDERRRHAIDDYDPLPIHYASAHVGRVSEAPRGSVIARISKSARDDYF